MRMDYPKTAGLLSTIKRAYDRLGAETEFVAEEPASEDDAYNAA